MNCYLWLTLSFNEEFKAAYNTSTAHQLKLVPTLTSPTHLSLPLLTCIHKRIYEHKYITSLPSHHSDQYIKHPLINMGSERDLLSTEIVNRGIESSGPNAGSLTFSVRVRRRLPDFLQSVNLKYVKLGYHYLINHAIYLATIPILVLLFSAEVGSLSREELWKKLWQDASYDLATVLASFGVFVFTLSVYFMSRPRSIYLIDFACYRPHDDLKVTSFHHTIYNIFKV